jgi:carbon monoxide dehydrogenase subunit G
LQQESAVSTKNDHSERGLTLLAGATALAYYFFLRPQLLKWGTRLGEPQRRLPGDDAIPNPNFQMTHAVAIDAPPEAVWAWLAQMGRNQTGYYGLDWMDNQGIPSITFIRQDLPAPEVGMAMDGGFHIMELEPGRQLLFGGFGLQQLSGVTCDITALYLLERQTDGSTRMLVRRRAFSYGMFSPLYNLIYEIFYFAWAVQQLKQIKRLAEGMAHLKPGPQP